MFVIGIFNSQCTSKTEHRSDLLPRLATLLTFFTGLLTSRFVFDLRSLRPGMHRTYDVVFAFALHRLSAHSYWKSFRPISNGQLHALLHFHLHPIYPVLFRGSLGLLRGYLILGSASRLDAFSVYPFRIWLPCYGIGCQQVHQ